MARLIAQSRIGALGIHWRGPVGEVRSTLSAVGAADSGGLPSLRARWFFDEPFPKFGRMDALCKIAVAAAQLIHKAGGFGGLNLDDVAQVGATALGCIEVDAQFEDSRRAGAPSPALFVYTLPSMFQGEIAIRFRLRGRCVLFAGGTDCAKLALNQAARMVDKGRAPAVLAIAADAARGHAEAEAWLVGSYGGLADLPSGA